MKARHTKSNRKGFILTNSIDDILYLNSSKWNIEGQLCIDDTFYQNVIGEAIVSNSTDIRGTTININRTFSCSTEDGLIYFDFDDTILKSDHDNKICRYTLNTPISADPLTGLYVISFDFIHAMYAQKHGNFSAQETFIKSSENTYKNNGFMFKNAKLHLRWDFLYTQI